MSEPSASGLKRAEAAFVAFLQKPRLPWVLAGVAVLLGSPSLFIGFNLDEILARYIYSDREGAARLQQLLGGGYAVANGDPGDMHFQIEEGIAPWWAYPTLLVRMGRPISYALHLFDFRLFPDSAALMHVHNLIWMALLVLAVTRLYRGSMGLLTGSVAALLFAMDHTHGFVVGYWANRHALVTAVFGVLALDQHLRFRSGGGAKHGVFASVLYAASLLAGESGIAIGGYFLGYALFVERGPLLRRVATFVPFLAVTVLWRAAYNFAGYGARGSGLYIDPFREPVRFIPALLERGPILVLGQFLGPPAEFYTIGAPWLSGAMLVLGVLFVVLLTIALVPVLREDRLSRFWAAGMVTALVPAAATYPHNRQLLFASFGALALIARIWQVHVVDLKGKKVPLLVAFSGAFSAVVFFFHLAVSPLLAPLAACSVVAARSLEAGIRDVGDEIAGKDVVFMTAPDYFAVKLVQFQRRFEERPLPRKWRGVSYGAQPITVHRTDDRTLAVDFEGGILGTPFMQLYRDARIAMHAGDRVELEGLTIEVTRVTADGRAERADFRFVDSLDAPKFVFYYWTGSGFSRYTPPVVGASNALPGAVTPWGVK